MALVRAVIRCLMIVAALAAIAAPLRAQNFPPPPGSLIEPLPAAETLLPAVQSPESYFDLDAWMGGNQYDPLLRRDDWCWQVVPDGILYRSYLASPKESRTGTQIFNSKDDGALWDSTVGGRFGLLRFGTTDPAWPQGWQFDVEGSAQVRLDPDEELDVRSTDYRIGAPLTYAYGRHRMKIGYYHLCAHFGDEFIEAHPTFQHVNFVRDVLTLGYAYFVTENVRIYTELGYAFYNDVSENWELQFGLEYAPARPTGLWGAPFFAIHGHLREELDYSGNLALQTGWAWRGNSSHILRTGLHYYNGLSSQYSTFRAFEQQIGAGLWYDF
jgi:hypothetical protein